MLSGFFFFFLYAVPGGLSGAGRDPGSPSGVVMGPKGFGIIFAPIFPTSWIDYE